MNSVMSVISGSTVVRATASVEKLARPSSSMQTCPPSSGASDSPQAALPMPRRCDSSMGRMS